MSTEVVMPQMGESIAEGTITKWLKKIGESVERDEPLFEISTDKVDAEIPSPAAGTLTEIKAQEGDTVAVNAIVAVINGAGGAAAAATPAAEQPTSEAPPQGAAPEVAAAAPPPTSSAPTPSTPAPAPSSAATAAPTSDSVPAAEIAQAAPQRQAQQQPASKRADGGTTATAAGDGSAAAEAEDLRRTRSSPLVRKIASEHGVDLSRLEGTGMSGRVTKNDILSYLESGTPAPAAATPQQPQQAAGAPLAPQQPAPAASSPAALPPITAAEGDRVETMSVMRRKIAEHMTLSRRTSAHVTTVYEIDMTRVARLRDQHKAAFAERHGTKLTYMPFIFQAVTGAIREFPIFNSQVSGDQIIYKHEINLGMAVALDWGLIVPVIKRADELSTAGLALAANDLAGRARSKQLMPNEVSGGTFTVTNPGVFGGLFGTPIINQPQVAILAIGVIEKRPKVMTGPDGDEYLAIRSMAYFALSFDHRIIDGSDAEKFLAHVKSTLEAGRFTV